ncbi:MAG: electron transfer flavoprotein subunit alpha/FixB family protein [Caldimicrobium sp.]|nr:electron transfer flavoprotein subunit alpha/FixB family protein [Caldimicrobium sp.]MCX7874458.1 electron transfer flavoprotein subunit alpha/FixB family protein [Caldimicrobium sp.]MDW8094106.1 electron transfer flavoprotein subunit alpha/FixB family protein [Caldimicrobium sp.]
MSETILAYGEFFEDKISPASLEILTPLWEISRSLQKKLLLLILSDDLKRVKEDNSLKRALCDEILVIEHQELKEFRDDLYSRVLSFVAREFHPYGFFFPATLQGLALAPRIAAELGVGLCAHVNALELEGERLIMMRPTFGDNIIAKLYSETYPIMATLALGAFSTKEGSENPIIKKFNLPQDFDWSSKMKVRAKRKTKKEINRLSVAKVVVAGGLGLKSKENFLKLFELAKYLEGEVGATRPVCYAGWTEEDRMIGISGVSVKPKLYLGFGISGAIQHTVGMENSEFIIAINTDEGAPLVKMAHVAIIADAEKILNYILKKLKS